MRAERFDFPNADGHQLTGLLESPAGDPVAYALFAHCFTCSKDSRAAKRMAEALAVRGIALLRFDFTGLGSSEGDFANTDFSSNVDDLVAAADHLRRTHQAPSLLPPPVCTSPRNCLRPFGQKASTSRRLRCMSGWGRSGPSLLIG